MEWVAVLFKVKTVDKGAEEEAAYFTPQINIQLNSSDICVLLLPMTRVTHNSAFKKQSVH